MQKIKDYIVGHWFEFLFRLITKERVELYLKRLSNTKDSCLEEKKCPECGCKLPHMLWVNDCPDCHIIVDKKPTEIFVSSPVKKGSNVSVKLTFDRPAKMLTKTCGCTVARLTDNNLGADIVINTDGQIGTQTKSISVSYQDGSQSVFKINYTIDDRT